MSLLLALIACKSEAPADTDAPVDTDTETLETYTPDWPGMVEFFGDHCVVCHQVGGTASSVFPDAIEADVVGQIGYFVVPGDPAGSRIWRVVSNAPGPDDYSEMPPSMPLPAVQVAHVEQWILAGAPVPVPGDGDGDGISAAEGDCDDANPSVFPGAPESCNGLDDDCSGVADDGIPATYTDADGDGHGDPTAPLDGCDPAGVASSDDCDDTDPAVSPSAPELCNGLDDDCDALVDPDTSVDAPDWYADLDGDGFGDPGFAQPSCDLPSGFVDDATDCDDTRPLVSPAGTEVCNGLDDDCDGTADDGATDTSLFWPDGDGDGYGTGTPVDACTAPAGYAPLDGDCNDNAANTHPGATEPCVGPPFDRNCDGQTGSGDNDGDGYSACQECDDTDPTVHPGAAELCNGTDDDCNGLVDDGASNGGTWYADLDGDGQGDPNAPVAACGAGAARVDNALDCDDTLATVFVGATEQCNGIDDDCDGQIDEGGVGSGTLYRDADGDGWGDLADSQVGCGLSGYVASPGDCDDADPDVHPGAPDPADGIDNDCDGLLDEDAQPTPAYSEIQAIWNARCTNACHGAPVPAGGLRLSGDSRPNLVGVPSSDVPSMNRVEPGAPDQSYLWRKLNGTHTQVGGTGNSMPNSGTPLTATQLATIEAWITGGAP